MEVGQLVAGKYRLNQRIGAGGMASVWSATNVFTEREFAIKFLLPEVAKTPEAARRFLREAKVSARINHPNIIEVIDVGQAEDGALFLVMELLHGVSLDVAFARHNPPMLARDFVSIMLDVAHALEAAHRSGVIHRDLKPTNIFLHKDRDGNTVPKVLDFGVSKILEEETNHALTVAGAVLGSPLYMSPEQAGGTVGVDRRTDVFAFGSILFEALTGQRAYDAPNFNALIVAVATTQPKNVDVVAPDLPLRLRNLVRGCLETDKEKRTASFELLGGQLTDILQELSDSPLRIAAGKRDGEGGDPEVTDALPVVRSYDRTSTSRRGAKTGTRGQATTFQKLPRKMGMLLAGAAMGGVLVTAVALTSRWVERRGRHDATVATPDTRPVMESQKLVDPTSPAPSSTVVRAESLPPAPARGRGR